LAQTVEASILLRARDLTNTAFRSVTRNLNSLRAQAIQVSHAMGTNRLGRPMMQVADAVGRISARIGPAVVGLAEIAGIGLGGGITALAVGLNQSVQALGGIADRRKQIGLTAQTLRELVHVAGLAGIEQKSLEGGLLTLARGYAQAQAGVGRMQAQLKKTNPVLLEQLKAARSTEEAFNIVMTAIRQAGSEAEKVRLSELFFGNADFTNLAAMSSDEFRKAMEEAGVVIGKLTDEQVDAVEELGDSMDTLKASVSGLFDAVAVELAPALNSAVTTMTKWIVANRRWLSQNIARSVTQFGRILGSVDWQGIWRGIENIARHANTAAQFFGGWENVLLGMAAIPFVGLARDVAFLAAGMVKLSGALLGTPIGLTLLTIGGAAWFLSRNLEKMWPHLEKSITSASDFAEALSILDRDMNETFDNIVRGLTGIDISHINLTAESIVKWGASIGDAFNRQIDEWHRAIADTVKGWQTQIEEAGAALVQALWDGMKRKFDELIGWLTSQVESIRNTIRSIVPLPGDTSTAAEMGARVGRMLGGQEPIPGRALGGQFRRGEFNVVGERGPELVKWGSSGNVIPTDQSRSLLEDRPGFLHFVLSPLRALGSSMATFTRVAEELERAISELTLKIGQQGAFSPVPVAQWGGTIGGDSRANMAQIQRAIGNSPISPQRVAQWGGMTGPSTGAVKPILDMVSAAEGTTRRGYNDSFAHQVREMLTNKTLAQIEQIQRGMKGSSAIGKYQFMRATLFGRNGQGGLVQELGLSMDDMFTPELQDRLATRLLERRGLKSWQTGRMSDFQFMRNLSKEWAGLTDPATGRGFYPGQTTGFPVSRQASALSAARQSSDFAWVSNRMMMGPPTKFGESPPLDSSRFQKGEVKVSIKVDGPGQVTSARAESDGNMQVAVGVDKTGYRAWKSGSGPL